MLCSFSFLRFRTKRRVEEGGEQCMCHQLHLFSGRRPTVLLSTNWYFNYSCCHDGNSYPVYLVPILSAMHQTHQTTASTSISAVSLPDSIRKSTAFWKGSVGTTTWGFDDPVPRPHAPSVFVLYADVGGVPCTKLFKTLGSDAGLEELLTALSLVVSRLHRRTLAVAGALSRALPLLCGFVANLCNMFRPLLRIVISGWKMKRLVCPLVRVVGQSRGGASGRGE